MAVPCDSTSLIDAAKCIQCIPQGMQFQVLVSLLCQIANNPSGGGAVTQLIAGTNITLNPAGGTGAVTINSTGPPAEFQSALFTLGTPQIANVAHGLGAMPQTFQARMRCVVADLASGMQVGDESEAACWFDSNSVLNLFNVIATTTNIIVTSTLSIIGNEGNVLIAGRSGGNTNITSGNNFRIKIYANL